MTEEQAADAIKRTQAERAKARSPKVPAASDLVARIGQDVRKGSESAIELTKALVILADSKPKRGRIKATVTFVDGVRFPSKLEADRYIELKSEVQACRDHPRRLGVKYFLRQVPFHLPGRRKYVCDFLVVEAVESAAGEIFERVTIEDCKGMLTEMSSLKIDQVLDLYGVEVRLIKRADVARAAA